MALKFTKDTPTPRSGGAAPAEAPVVPYTYEDMRGHPWNITWRASSEAWVAYPTDATADAYGLERGRMYSSGSDAAMVIDGIEERLETARANNKLGPKSNANGWAVLLLLALAWAADKRKGR